MEYIYHSNSLSCQHFGLPEPDFSVGDYRGAHPGMRFSPAEHATAFEERLATLNPGQLAAVEALRRNLASTDVMEPKCRHDKLLE